MNRNIDRPWPEERVISLINGIAMPLIGYTYLVEDTPSRSAAFGWMWNVLPGVVDIGWMLVAAGLFSLLAVVNGKVWATANGLVVITWIAFAAVFAEAYVSGRSPTAWVSVISYITYAALSSSALLGDLLSRRILIRELFLKTNIRSKNHPEGHGWPTRRKGTTQMTTDEGE